MSKVCAWCLPGTRGGATHVAALGSVEVDPGGDVYTVWTVYICAEHATMTDTIEGNLITPDDAGEYRVAQEWMVRAL